LHPFDYEKPTSLEEAGALLAQTTANVVVLAGGSDVLLRIEEEAIRPQVLIDIKGLPELREISFSADGGLSLGATTTISALTTHSDVRRHYPLLAEVSHQIGSARIRNRATMAAQSALPCPRPIYHPHCSAMTPFVICGAHMVSDLFHSANSTKGRDKLCSSLKNCWCG